MSTAAATLRDLREKILLAPDFVERCLRLGPGTLERIERGDEELDTSLLDSLADFYGVSAADVEAGTVEPESLEPVRVLLKASVQLSPSVRRDVARIAQARRELRMLERELGVPDRYAALRRSFRHEGVYNDPGAEWREGRDLAHRVREHFGLRPTDSITSLRDLVQKLGIELVNADLTDSRVAGFSLADDVHGPTIVVNARGQNSNPWVRRFTIAHELCHVLHDEKMHREVSPVQYYDEDVRVGPEPRANAFAAVLLAPDDGIRGLLGNKPQQSLAREVRTVMAHFGINFKTARYRLRHAWNAPEQQLNELRGVPTEPASDEWRIAEAFWDAEYFACPTVPMERRGLLARRVVEAWSKKLFDRRQALELLHAAPDEPLEALRELPDLN